MNRVKEASQYVLFAVVAVAMLIAIVLPAIASAAQLSNRSAQLSNASAGAEEVSYALAFTAIGEADKIDIEFCDSAFGDCDAPVGMSTADATTSTANFTITKTVNTVALASNPSIPAGPVSVTVDNIKNPSAASTIYARIATTNDSEPVDNGVVAILITPTIEVTGIVEETLAFCISATAIATDCSGVSQVPVTLALGEGNPKVLQPNALSFADLYTQISTNASTGAIVYLKSSASSECGGLMLAGDSEGCYITPASAMTTDNMAERSQFGVMIASVADIAGSSGAFQSANSEVYSGASYNLRHVDEDDGVTSTFGDEFLNTNSLPAIRKGMKLTFGATITDQTPAGTYSTDISLIATGKF